MGDFGQTGSGNIPKDMGGGSGKLAQFYFGNDRSVKRRIMFLDGENGMPFGFWLHEHFIRSTDKRVEEVCLLRNNLGDRCPLCDHKSISKDKKTGEEKETTWYPSYVGCYTLLEMGMVIMEGGRSRIVPTERVYKGKTYRDQWRRKLLLLKRGGEKRPGALMKITNLVGREFGEEVPNFKGVVCDVVRNPGDQTDRVGDDWKIVTYQDAPLRVAPEKWVSYLQKICGMTDEELKNVEKYKHLEPIDHRAHWKEKTVAELERILAAAHSRGEPEKQDEEKPGGIREGGGGDYEGKSESGMSDGGGEMGDPPGWVPGDQIPDDDIPF